MQNKGRGTVGDIYQYQKELNVLHDYTVIQAPDNSLTHNNLHVSCVT